MSAQELKKSVPIYFYYLTISKQKGSKDESIYDISKVIDSLSNMFTYVIGKDLTERKKDNKSSEKVIWLDSVKDLKDGNYDLIFKSAKYNHVRNEIDTETMKELGTRKDSKMVMKKKHTYVFVILEMKCDFLRYTKVTIME